MTQHAVWKKMGYKGESPVAIVNAPDSFSEISGSIDAEILSGNTPSAYSIFFAITLDDLKSWGDYVRTLPAGDIQIWIAYPKKSSKKYKAEFNRDAGWENTGEIGCEPVRMIAVDEDWSALRFRRTEFIKTLKRRHSMAISKAGKERTKNNK